MKITVSAGSVSDGQGNKYRTGEVVDVDDALAKSWIATGAARPTTEVDEQREDNRVEEHKAPDASKRPTTRRTATRGDQKLVSDESREQQSGREQAPDSGKESNKK